MMLQKYQNQIYAGVLGKIIGVYLGRPVEGWSYEKIQIRLAKYTTIKIIDGSTLIVPDDDI